MSDTLDFLEDLIREYLLDLNVCMIAKILKFDAVTMKADIQPLHKRIFKGSEPVDLPPLVSVPVSCQKAGGFIIRPPYKKGDLVFVIFADRALDGIFHNGQDDHTLTRDHSLDDAIVVCGINLFTHNLPSSHSSDLLIAKEDLGSKIVLKENNDIVIETTGKIYLGEEDATEGVPLGAQLKTWLDGHKHTYGSGLQTNGPVSASPNPSEKVVVK